MNVERQIQAITMHRSAGIKGPRNALVIGASTGYGLASRIAAAWGFGAQTLGVFFERPPEGEKTATAGFYNTVALHRQAEKDDLLAISLNGDAFSDELKRNALEIVREEIGCLDLVIYSLAAPKRTHPRSKQIHNSALKPIGQPYTNKTIELDSERVASVTIPPASEKEIADTIAVMGGEDWRMWIELLGEEELLAENARTLAFSYIGPELTWPIYRDGTIGRAKKDLEETARHLNATLRNRLGGSAWISINKAAVTQASAAIPVVPLYISLLSKIMKSKGLEEGPIQQMRRLFFEHLAAGSNPAFDEEERIRLDDREMRADVQAAVAESWPRVTTENLAELTDFAGFKRQFRNLFGFEVEGVNYTEPTETDLSW